MIKQPTYYITLLLVMLLSASCSNSHTTLSLDRAEEMLLSSPDSARTILGSIVKDELYSKSDKMKHTLLKAVADDAAGLGMPKDSVLYIVSEYYSNKEDDYHFLSLYCMGRSHQLAGHSTKAILEYTQAEQYINNVSQPEYIALLYSNMASLFTESFDYQRALQLYNNAHTYFKLSGLKDYEHATIIKTAHTLIELKRYDEAEELLLEELQWGCDNNDKEVSQNCIENLLKLYSRTSYYSKSEWLLGSEYAKEYDTTHIVNLTLAYIYATGSDMKSSNRHMRQAWQQSATINDTLATLTQMYDISRMRGDNENALYILENIYYIHDTIMRSVLRQPLLTSQRDYYQSQVQISEYKLASTERMAAVIVIITILLLCLAMLVMQKRIAQKNAQIERYAEVADEMSRSLFAKKAEVDDISSRLSTHNARIAEMDKQVAVLFKKQFELLNELSSTFYETHGIKKDKEAIYKHVRENIESFMKNKREIEHLENIVDNYRGGIIGKLREEFPQFGEHDIRFIVFICAGFSPKAISIFMEESVGNIYTKKSRIKSIISRSDSTHKELFIEALS